MKIKGAVIAISTESLIQGPNMAQVTTPAPPPRSPNYHIMPTRGLRATKDLMCNSTCTRRISFGTRTQTHDMAAMGS
ncbi:hypothetical protein TNCV_1083061 [Trichonephila clavipes]|nr:hypothetical protein TNCV_1083061 [Trichonephila clavipes]